jgi:hypothetical protein
MEILSFRTALRACGVATVLKLNKLKMAEKIFFPLLELD